MIKIADIPSSISVSQVGNSTIKAYVGVRLPVKHHELNKDYWIFKEECSIENNTQIMTQDYMIMMSVGKTLERLGRLIQSRAIIKD